MKAAKNQPITEAVHQIIPPAPSPLAKRLGRRKLADPPVHTDPRDELRRLVREHQYVTRLAVADENQSSDRTNRETGAVIKCPLPEHLRQDRKRAAKALRSYAATLKPAMKRELMKMPVFTHFLSKVWGIVGENGGTVGAYLCASIRIERCIKPSQLNRYCGNACGVDGKREIRSGGCGPKYGPDGALTGATGTYNDVLKSVIWQGMCAMRQSAAKPTAGRPFGTTTKYLDVWRNAVHWRKTNGKEKGADAAGRRKATDLFLEDLYVVMRTLEGLPVWPDLYSARRGYRHGGAPCINEGVVLTLEEALAHVGDVGPRPAAAPDVDADACEGPEEDALGECAAE
jgi:hypothetical protein